MTWSAYDVGSSGYVEASAVADALMREHDVRIRIMPSGTSIGRLLPLRTERVQFGWLANEVYFATEALYEFASQEWGPQDLRVLIGRPASFGIGVAGDAGVTDLEDLRGKRVARVQANPSVNVKVEAIMALADLTWDDVEVVEVPSYGASLRGLVEGTIDAAGTITTAATMRELEASARGLVWPNLPPAEDEEAWDRLREVAPIFEAIDETIGAGVSEDNPATLIAYPLSDDHGLCRHVRRDRLCGDQGRGRVLRSLQGRQSWHVSLGSLDRRCAADRCALPSRRDPVPRGDRRLD